MNETFKTSRYLFYITLIYFFIAVLIFAWITIKFEFKEGILINVLSIALFLVLPILNLLTMIKISFIDVKIDENGISKFRFNKLIFNISWDELRDVKFYNPICPWIIFSKKSLDGIGVNVARLFMPTIPLLYVEEIMPALYKYCTNKEILKKIDKK